MMNVSQEQRPEQHEEPRQIHASNLDVLHEESASPEIKRLYQHFREDFARPQVPGILQCFATHPQLLTHMMGLAKSMLFIDGALGRQHKEIISTFVSALNKCNYCADSHAYSLRMQGGSAPAMHSVLACDVESNSIKPAESALLWFVRKVSEGSQSIAPLDVQAMRLAGWTGLQIAEAIRTTALFDTFNRVVNAFGLPSQELLKQFGELRQQAADDGAYA